jgi:hypothetical protein
MDARLLDPEAYRVKTQPFPMPTAPAAPLNDPTAYQVEPGPTGAQWLAHADPAPMPTAASPAETMAQPAASPPMDPRRAFRKKVNETARAYKQSVEARRAQRKALSAYSKLKGQLESSAGTLSDLNTMETSYPEVYAPDSPATMALQKHKITHFEKAQRLREQLNKQAQQLHQQFGLPLGKNGGLAEEDNLADAGDAQFDDEIKQGYIEALMSQPPQ